MRHDRRDSMAGNPQQVAHCSNQTPNQNAIQGHILIDKCQQDFHIQAPKKGIKPLLQRSEWRRIPKEPFFPLHGAAKEKQNFHPIIFLLLHYNHLPSF